MNHVLDFGGHFLSLGEKSFFKRGFFSTPTGVYTHKRKCSNAIATAKFPEIVGCARTTLPRALNRR
jgi:hypothetical protein